MTVLEHPASEHSSAQASQLDRPAQRSRFRIMLSRWDHKGSSYAFVSPFFLIFGVFGAFPLLYTLWISLHAWPLLGPHHWVGLDNYRKLLAIRSSGTRSRTPSASSCWRSSRSTSWLCCWR